MQVDYIYPPGLVMQSLSCTTYCCLSICFSTCVTLPVTLFIPLFLFFLLHHLGSIQKRYREQEAERTQSRYAPVKAVWTSSKYLNVPSKVKDQLQVGVCRWTTRFYYYHFNFTYLVCFKMQVPNSAVKPQCQNFLKAHVGTALSRECSQTSPKALRRSSSCNFTKQENLQVSIVAAN